MTVISTALEQPPKPGFPRTHGVVKPLESTVLVCSYRASIKQDLEATGPDTGSQGPLLQDHYVMLEPETLFFPVLVQ